jgi:hypothetical protein
MAPARFGDRRSHERELRVPLVDQHVALDQEKVKGRMTQWADRLAR